MLIRGEIDEQTGRVVGTLYGIVQPSFGGSADVVMYGPYESEYAARRRHSRLAVWLRRRSQVRPIVQEDAVNTYSMVMRYDDVLGRIVPVCEYRNHPYRLHG